MADGDWAIGRLEDEISSLTQEIASGFRDIDANISGVQNDVDDLKTNLGTVMDFLKDFMEDTQRANNITHSQGQITILNQEIAKEFGLYEDVRRNLIGILQGVDSGIISKQIITDISEELMIGTPRYWLTPTLISIGAWINNDETLSKKALNEGLRRNKQKTALLFVLLTHRLRRQDAAFLWLQQYMEEQSPYQMPQETLMLINAYSSGVFGPDTHGICMEQISKWVSELSKSKEAVIKLQDNWTKRVDLMPSAVSTDKYTYLKDYCPQYSLLMDLLKQTGKNESFLNYLTNILSSAIPKHDYTQELDNLLFQLVREFDEDEFDKRGEHKLHELIVKNNGDKNKAKQEFNITAITLFKHRISFFEILTNALSEENSTTNLKKLAISLMKEWILNGYQDFAAAYRAKTPSAIDIKIQDWSGKSVDGSENESLLKSFRDYLDKCCEEAKAKVVSIPLIVFLSLLSLIFLTISFGLFFICLLGIGIWAYTIYQKKKAIQAAYDKQKEEAKPLIDAILAEYIDWKRDFAKNDDNEKVPQYLKNYSMNDFTSTIADKKILL
ncbi:MAG: hypothetical protein LBN20_04220 [Endomicrobium sp.]|jgi:hypothetical protein|nr:hypothetical protein [Endomicrobium sp.]